MSQPAAGRHGRRPASPDETAAALFRALGDTSRVAILRHLLLGEHRVGELVEHLGLAQSTVSQHLGWLRDAGLLTVRPVGRASVYAVRDPERVRELLAAAEQLLAIAPAMHRCPVAGCTRGGGRGSCHGSGPERCAALVAGGR